MDNGTNCGQAQGDSNTVARSHTPLGREKLHVIDSVDSNGDLESKPYGPLTQEEAEELQREANEDTTRSEDLRQFLKEMHEKLMEEQKQHQQQQQLQNAPGFPPMQPVPNLTGNVYNAIAPSGSQYSLIGQPGPDPEVDLHTRRQSQIGQPSQGLARLISQTTRPSMTDLNIPDNPPDGGWGWIVVLGSFCCMILVDGICLSYGLLLTPQCGYSGVRPLNIIRPTNRTVAMSSQSSFVMRADRSLKPVVGSCIPVSEMGEALGTQDRALLLTPGALLIGLYLLLGSPVVRIFMAEEL
ncbi:unnamed protein product [Echinostoma caproni]|uniref:Transmembrane protein n=1 Tax=Echinostoma caproni TaxID=27848 RepID=A0A183B0R9_9TREM|nr:unnamed protein product [Echinostoma caproni]